MGKPQNSYFWSATNPKAEIKKTRNGSSNDIEFKRGDVLGCIIKIFSTSEVVERRLKHIQKNKARKNRRTLKPKPLTQRVYGCIKYTKNGKIVKLEDPGLEGPHLGITATAPYFLSVDLEEDA